MMAVMKVGSSAVQFVGVKVEVELAQYLSSPRPRYRTTLRVCRAEFSGGTFM